jgi:hypothetical protein
MRQLAASCHEEGIHMLQASIHSIVGYNAWLGLHGTVAVTSLQLYYSTVNKHFRDHQQQPIATGKPLADARRGMEMQKQRILEFDDARLPIRPCPPLVRFKDTRKTYIDTDYATRNCPFSSYPRTLYELRVFYRAESRVPCRTGDLTVDRPSGQICLFIRKAKGDQRCKAADKLLLTIPIEARPR